MLCSKVNQDQTATCTVKDGIATFTDSKSYSCLVLHAYKSIVDGVVYVHYRLGFPPAAFDAALLHDAVNFAVRKAASPTKQELAQLLTCLMNMLDNKQFRAYELVEESYLEVDDADKCLRTVAKVRQLGSIFDESLWADFIETAQ